MLVKARTRIFRFPDFWTNPLQVFVFRLYLAIRLSFQCKIFHGPSNNKRKLPANNQKLERGPFMFFVKRGILQLIIKKIFSLAHILTHHLYTSASSYPLIL